MDNGNFPLLSFVEFFEIIQLLPFYQVLRDDVMCKQLSSAVVRKKAKKEFLVVKGAVERYSRYILIWNPAV